MSPRRALRAFSFGLLLCVSRVASAAGPDAAPRPLSASLTGEAATAYQSAKLLFDDGDRAGALEKFKRAHDLSQDPRLLWNMAVCEKELRHYAAATALVTQYLKEGGSKLTAQNRADAAETETALRAFYSLVTIEGAPAGARVSVDGVEIGKAPLSEPVPMDLGRRTIRVELEGYEPFSTTLDVPGNTATSVPVSMKAEVVTARLAVSATGERDLIKVDGKAVGTAHWEGVLAPGPHDVRVTADGKKPYQTHVLLAAHSTRTLSVSLESEEHKGAVWPWLVGGAALAGGIAVSSYLIFKPKDEAGSSPVGKLATVFVPASYK